MFQNKEEDNDLSSPPRRRQGAIILAGGLGTRLRTAVPNLPKCMAPVASRPFLGYVIDHLRMQGITNFIFSLGYKAEVIQNYLNEYYPTLQYQVVIEEEPLGTGGAIQLALQRSKNENVLIVNGDTLFKINVPELFAFHKNTGAECTLGLKPMKDFDRYGVVDIDKKGKVVSFKEKQLYNEGLINGGVYLLNRIAFLKRSFPQIFSFEKEYLEQVYTEGCIYACRQEGYFIDIGIPADYEKAQSDLKQKNLSLDDIDKSWTLFLDRDGVINNELPGNYVLNWSQFQFSEGVLEGLKILKEKFGRILVVSNQRGVGKGLMNLNDLEAVHQPNES